MEHSQKPVQKVLSSIQSNHAHKTLQQEIPGVPAGRRVTSHRSALGLGSSAPAAAAAALEVPRDRKWSFASCLVGLPLQLLLLQGLASGEDISNLTGPNVLRNSRFSERLALLLLARLLRSLCDAAASDSPTPSPHSAALIAKGHKVRAAIDPATQASRKAVQRNTSIHLPEAPPS